VVKIRLRRVGAKKQPSYRIVVSESTSPRDGRFIEIIGHYNPRTEPETVVVDRERALHWLGLGAQPTPAVERLLKRQGVMDALAQVKAGAAPAEALAATQPSLVPAPVAAAPLPVVEPEPEPAPAEVPPEALPVADLELPEEISGALQDAGLHTVGEVMAHLAQGDRALLEIPEIGGRDVELIKDKLAELGLVIG
jgi:small subunit ribosomal protein S16